MSGTIAAITAARKGLKTALIQNRPVLGGNASSEIRMHICGADNHAQRPNARETGILEEMLLENKYRNPANSFEVFDLILWEKAHYQSNLDLYLNAQMVNASRTNDRIEFVDVDQLTNEKQYRFYGDYFVDATGDGTLGALVGAEYRSGREAESEFHEPYAPKKADNHTMGSSIQFTAKDMGHPVPFTKPSWAYTYHESDLAGRDHSDITAGYWWIELGGSDGLDTISDAENIRDELLKVALGIWDHIKNDGDHGASNYALDWIGFLPGKRESRRFIGDYTLTANDILENTSFGDAIAYGGWPMDLHAVGGIAASSDDPTTYYKFKDVYQIPYRCLYSRNIDNLFLGGRLISTTHIAFGSTRVMGTCSVIGQAIGLATWLAERYSLTPRKVGKRKIQELQQEALKEDLYIPRVINEDPLDLARSATVSASSLTSSRTAASAVINGTARTVADKLNYWESATDGEEWIDLDLSRAASIRELNIRFDSNLSREIMPSLLTSRMALQEKRVQSTLVKDFTVQFFDKEKIVKEVSVRDNYMRNYWLRLEEPVLSDKVHIMLHSTNGDKHHRIFEIRCYE